MPDPIVLTDHKAPVLALISLAQEDLLRRCRELGYGHLVILFQDGEPSRIERGVESIKLGER